MNFDCQRIYQDKAISECLCTVFQNYFVFDYIDRYFISICYCENSYLIKFIGSSKEIKLVSNKYYIFCRSGTKLQRFGHPTKYIKHDQAMVCPLVLYCYQMTVNSAKTFRVEPFILSKKYIYIELKLIQCEYFKQNTKKSFFCDLQLKYFKILPRIDVFIPIFAQD